MHEITRILRAFASRPWFIEGGKAREIVALLELRHSAGPRLTPYRQEGVEIRFNRPLAYWLKDGWRQTEAYDDGETPAERRERRIQAAQPVSAAGQKKVGVIQLYGAIVPRAERVADVSQTAASMVEFQDRFSRMAADSSIGAIVIDVDSPGGSVDLVPETAAMIRRARSEERPIIAVANTMAASAAYWIASAANELVVTPSGAVGSVGVYLVHEDVSEALRAEGVNVTMIFEGARKVEANPFGPLDDVARRALQAEVRQYYDMFTSDVAKNRGVSVSVVRADPEKEDKSFGGGRVMLAKQAVEAGLADRIGTYDEVISEALAVVSGGGSRRRRSTASMRRRLSVI